MTPCMAAGPVHPQLESTSQQPTKLCSNTRPATHAPISLTSASKRLYLPTGPDAAASLAAAAAPRVPRPARLVSLVATAISVSTPSLICKVYASTEAHESATANVHNERVPASMLQGLVQRASTWHAPPAQ